MAAPRKYPDELRERAIRMAVDLRRDPATRVGALARVGQQLGINPETLRNWVNQAEIDSGQRPGTTTADAQRIAELEREVRELRRSNAILRSASGFLRGGARPPVDQVVAFIDAHRAEFGVEPICKDLQVAPSTYYAAKTRPPSARAVADAALGEVITVEHAANYGVYGARKMWKHLHRVGHPVARCTVERLMREHGLRGVVRGRAKRTTIPTKDGVRAGDLVNRAFTATAPNQLWVADFTYVRTWAGFSYVAFVIDVFSRMIVGWKADTRMRADLVTDTLEMAVWARGRAGVVDLSGLIHHSDAGAQYVSLALTERLAALGMRASIGSVADAYDNAMAESTIGLFKNELIRRKGPWRTLDDVEIATLEYVDWFNKRRLHTELGDIPPAEHEANYYRQNPAVTTAETREPSLH
ncbi:IS3 family transposase [Cellulomonas alba]|uniref:IS3 family transposase n=1 Tax=Cellulomonas alba TaxID=3053467 RepID=A0ABT7SKF3_9CELL|nr:IS3 family transposase [Cellulomonas alba]MDM7856671.1 IS3 family transposase [Cellulomonas alba]